MKINFNFLKPNFSSYYDIFSKGAIALAVFLLPLFFLPQTYNVLDFNKQALLLFLVFTAFIAWMIKALASGKVSLNLNFTFIPLGIYVLVTLASAITSLWAFGSFWGWPSSTSESFISVLCLSLLFVLFLNVLDKKDLPWIFFSFVISWTLVLIYAILQIFGKFVFPFNFSKNTSFNSVGTVFGIAILTAALIPLIIFLLINSRKVKRIFYILFLVLAVFFLFLINFYLSWWILILGSALVITLGTQKKETFNPKWITLPMFLMAAPLLFLIFKFQISGLPAIAPEIFLKAKITIDIAAKVLKESPVLGSGPGTFSYDFSKFKRQDLNATSFWNTRFESGNSKFLSLLSTIGILGVLSLLFFIGSIFLYGIRFLFKKTKTKESEESKSYEILSTGILSFISLMTVSFFFYNSNLTLDFIYFVFIAGFIALNTDSKKEFYLKPSSLPTLVATFSFTIVFIICLGIGILEAQRYSAEANYLAGLKDLQQGKNSQAASRLEKAVVLSSGQAGGDLYLRQLSQIYLARANEEIARKDIAQENVNRNVQAYIGSAINSAKAATEANSKNVVNWESLGSIYQSMIGVISGSEDWAGKSYDEAIKLEPSNPDFLIQKGIVLLRQAETLSESDATKKTQVLTDAKEQFEKALALKSNYFLPHLELSVLYQIEGDRDNAIKEMQQASVLTGNSNTGVVFQLGLLYYRKKDFDNAQGALEYATSLDSNYANALYFLGLVYDAKGQKQKAKEKFVKILGLNPDNEEIKKIIANLTAGNDALAGIGAPQQSVVPNTEQPPKESEKLQTENPLKPEAPTKKKK